MDSFERILFLLHEAALDPARWPAAACLIDEVSGVKGSALGFGGGSWGRPTVSFALICIGGERRKDLEQRYFRDYWSGDERITRLARLRHGELKHNSDLYTDREKQVSPAYNEMLRDTESQNGLHVRLDGPQGSNIVWSLADSTEPEGWSSAQIETISSLLPHIRQFVRMRQALADSAALGSSLADLLDNTRLGVIHLDRRGRIVAANDRAGGLLRQGDGLADRAGYLGAGAFAENVGLQRLLARALPPPGTEASAGSMTLRRTSSRTRLVVHVNPVTGREGDFRARRVAVLVLVVDPESSFRIDPVIVAGALGLTAAESQLAVMVAVGHSVRAIAKLTGRKEDTVRWHLKRIFRKQRLKSQADLVRRVLSLDGLSRSPR